MAKVHVEESSAHDFVIQNERVVTMYRDYDVDDALCFVSLLGINLLVFQRGFV